MQHHRYKGLVMSNIIKESINETIGELEKILSPKQKVFFQNNKRKFFITILVFLSIEAFVLIGGLEIAKLYFNI